MAALDTVNNTLANTPLFIMVEKMGLAVAHAQRELDLNSIELLKSLCNKEITIGDGTYNLITLGFTPSFYAFTEATFEAKLEFSVAESEAFSVGATVGVNLGIISASVNASYARKFDQSAQGSSSISVKMVSLPPPDNFLSIVKESLKTK